MKSVRINKNDYYEDLVTLFGYSVLPPTVYYYFKKSNDKKIRFRMFVALIIAALGFIGIGVFGVLYSKKMIVESIFNAGIAVTFVVFSLGGLFFWLVTLQIKKIRNSFSRNETAEFYLKINKNILPTIHQCRTATRKAYVDFQIKKEEAEMMALSDIGKEVRRFSEDYTRLNDMSGLEFENYCCRMLAFLGYKDIKITPESGDQGVDIIASKDNDRYAFQCKRYSESLGNSPIQEVFAGARFYNANKCVVITNSTFTKGAIDLANATNVDLWDGRAMSFLYKRIVEAYEKALKEQISKQFDKEKKKNELEMYVSNLSDDKIDELFFQLNFLSYSGCTTPSSFEIKTKEFISKYS